MTWEWKIGDPVDDANGGTMDAQNWHGDYYFEEDIVMRAELIIPKAINIQKKHGIIIWILRMKRHFIILTWLWIWMGEIQITGT